jgi:hypothetical protein
VDRALLRQVEPSIDVIRAAAPHRLQALLTLRDQLRGRAGSNSSTPAPAANPVAAGATPGRANLLRSVKDVITDTMTFPDEHKGWIPHAVRAGRAVARTRKIDCLYASGGPWSGLVAAARLHERTRIPLVLDFRDPWASNPNRAGGSARSLAAHRRLEAFCIGQASRIISNTPELRDDFVRRYPAIDPRRFVAITNGFEKLPELAVPPPARFTLVHAGALYLSRNPRNLLLALKRLVSSGSVPRDLLRVQFVGGVADQEGEAGALLRELGEVVEIVPRVPHARAVELQRGSSVLLLFQSGFPLQVPRKLFEYLAIGRPIFAITEEASATARILDDAGVGKIAADDPDQIAHAIRELYQAWRSGNTSMVDPQKLHRYSNEYLSARLRAEMSASAQGS